MSFAEIEQSQESFCFIWSRQENETSIFLFGYSLQITGTVSGFCILHGGKSCTATFKFTSDKNLWLLKMEFHLIKWIRQQRNTASVCVCVNECKDNHLFWFHPRQAAHLVHYCRPVHKKSLCHIFPPHLVKFSAPVSLLLSFWNIKNHDIRPINSHPQAEKSCLKLPRQRQHKP